MSDTLERPILVVEDSPEDFEVLSRAFRKAEMFVPLQRAEDGQEALNYLHRLIGIGDDVPPPALILMDLNLPGIDGVELIKQIKSSPKTAAIPLLVLTTSHSERDVQQTYAAGANSFLSKPSDMAGYIRLAQMIKAYWFECAILP